MQWSLATVVLVPRGVTAHASAGERRRILDWAARTGFSGIEVSPQWLDIRAPSAELVEFRSQAAQAGLRISGINVNRCLFTRGPRASQSLTLIQRAIDAAAILATDLVTLSLSLPLEPGQRPALRGSDVPDDERARAASVLSELAALAARQGIQLSLELHDDGILDTPEYCLDMVRRIGASNVGVNPDLGNLIRSSEAPAAWEAALLQLAPRANNWHVKNYRGAQPVPLWEGDIDYGRAIRIMQAVEYRGSVSIESYFGDVLDLQERSLNYLRRLGSTSNSSVDNTPGGTWPIGSST